jgi:hypothetical protein
MARWQDSQSDDNGNEGSGATDGQQHGRRYAFVILYLSCSWLLRLKYRDPSTSGSPGVDVSPGPIHESKYRMQCLAFRDGGLVLPGRNGSAHQARPCYGSTGSVRTSTPSQHPRL